MNSISSPSNHLAQKTKTLLSQSSMCFPKLKYASLRKAKNDDQSNGFSFSDKIPHSHSNSADWKSLHFSANACEVATCHNEHMSTEQVFIGPSTFSGMAQQENHQAIDPVPFTETLLQRHQLFSLDTAVESRHHQNKSWDDHLTLPYSMSRYLQVASNDSRQDANGVGCSNFLASERNLSRELTSASNESVIRSF